MYILCNFFHDDFNREDLVAELSSLCMLYHSAAQDEAWCHQDCTIDPVHHPTNASKYSLPVVSATVNPTSNECNF